MLIIKRSTTEDIDLNSLNRAIQKTKRIGNRKRKRILQLISSGDEANKKILLVAGCQRSGTSMMYKTFERDPVAAVYDEVDVISNKDRVEGLRLNELDTVLANFVKNPATLVVAKPLVESQRIAALLDNIPNSKCIWMYRHYSDVASSNLKRFGDNNGVTDIEPIFRNDQSNWRCEGLSDEVRNLITSFKSRGLLEGDAAALFWYARNSLYFQQSLENDDRVYLCQYEHLVKKPQIVIKDIYRFIGVPYPSDKVLFGISPRSIGKGSDILLSDDIRELCDAMMDKLHTVARVAQ